MKKAWLALIFGSALFLAACGGGDDEATDTDTATEDTATEDTTDSGTGDTAGGADAGQGEEIVKSNCISCHGGNLEGMGNTPSLADVGSRLSEEEIHDVILNGRGGMPGGLLQGEDAEAAAAWLSQQQ